jgi:hypothetical protein
VVKNNRAFGYTVLTPEVLAKLAKLNEEVRLEAKTTTDGVPILGIEGSGRVMVAVANTYRANDQAMAAYKKRPSVRIRRAVKKVKALVIKPKPRGFNLSVEADTRAFATAIKSGVKSKAVADDE